MSETSMRAALHKAALHNLRAIHSYSVKQRAKGYDEGYRDALEMVSSHIQHADLSGVPGTMLYKIDSLVEQIRNGEWSPFMADPL